ncbi:transglycosylase SLT domain-containing protein [Duganella sp. FT92W]|uniref:Transglycosylase SLT domain-containing protein n=1 Tax=Pseudoduganella rivuli TaxID=2666085 RepID=A0A7X2IUP5_9BURK|nr:transglycosylase SLT domain-containing protein [Pseudoduganella rivuli]MRV76452.1 transglycosylase SLT domain-containing protein [Pseudoduganella rivuli]
MERDLRIVSLMALLCISTPLVCWAAEEASAEELAAQAARHEHGEGVPRDPVLARTLYCRAARQGYAPAQYALGWMLANGRGGARDDSAARHLFTLAAAQGHMQAQTMATQLSATPVAPACLLPDLPPQPKFDLPPISMWTPNPQVARLVGRLAPEFNVDPLLVLAIISVESGFNSRAVSPRQAQGLMQLIPETAQRFQVRDVFNEEQNVRGGLAYLRWLLAYFKGNVTLVTAAYNAGEKAVDRYGGVPPYPETRDYVKKISTLYHQTIHPYQRDLLPVTSPIAAK